jgi:hypothetical protein
MALYQAIVHARNLGDDELISILEKAQKEEWYSKEAAKVREMLLVSESQRESVDRVRTVGSNPAKLDMPFKRDLNALDFPQTLLNPQPVQISQLELHAPWLESRFDAIWLELPALSSRRRTWREYLNVRGAASEFEVLASARVYN